MISKLFHAHSIYDDEDILLFWQKKIFKYSVLFILIFSIVPGALSLSAALKTPRWQLIAVCSVIYILGICIALSEKIHFPARVWAGLSVFYALGVAGLLTSGLPGGRICLLCFCAFAAVFTNLKGAMSALFINILTLILIGFLFDRGSLIPRQAAHMFDLQEWFVGSGTFGFLCAAVAAPISVLVKVFEHNGNEFNLVMKNTSEMIWAMDKDRKITFVNAPVTRIFGFRQEDWIGMPLNRFLSEKDGGQFRKKVLSGTDFTLDATILHKDGTPVPVEISSSHTGHFPGSGVQYQGTIRDISQVKQQQELQDRLKQKLQEAEKLKGLGILAGSVAHDLNNILSGIATYPEVLLMDDELDPAVEKGLKIIRDSGQKASAVVSDLLTISRGARMEKEVININALLERYTHAHDFIKIKRSYPKVSIDLMTEPELLNIKGSYIHIEKSIMNLLLNAVEEVSIRPDGQVMISTANAFLDSVIPGFENRTQGEYVIISVTDNGSGISEEDREKIFNPFYTKKEMGKSGTGLGLTVVWNTVLDHDGYVDVKSTAYGTTFDLIFPATRKEIPEKPPAGSLDEIKGQGQTILVVDDLKDQQDTALTILTNLGYNARAVNNGYDAVDIIRQTPTDLVILDMIMDPSISGLETYKMIQKVNPGQKAIIASGYAESEDVQTAQHLGAGSFVKKPYTILDMGIAVKEELEK